MDLFLAVWGGRDVDCVLSQQLPLHLLPLEPLEKMSNADNWLLSCLRTRLLTSGENLHLISVSLSLSLSLCLIKIFFTKTMKFSTPTIQTNTVTAFHLMASRFGEVVWQLKPSLAHIVGTRSLGPFTLSHKSQTSASTHHQWSEKRCTQGHVITLSLWDLCTIKLVQIKPAALNDQISAHQRQRLQF